MEKAAKSTPAVKADQKNPQTKVNATVKPATKAPAVTT